MTNDALAETPNLSREKLGPETANAMLDRLIEGTRFEIGHAARADFNAGRALFRQRPTLSFVDATNVAHMEREGVDYLYSFGDGFGIVDGLVRLATADDPFAG